MCPGQGFGEGRDDGVAGLSLGCGGVDEQEFGVGGGGVFGEARQRGQAGADADVDGGDVVAQGRAVRDGVRVL